MGSPEAGGGGWQRPRCVTARGIYSRGRAGRLANSRRPGDGGVTARGILVPMRRSPSDESSFRRQSSTAGNADTAGHDADTSRTEKLLHREITKSILACFYAVYDRLGFGFLENVYCGALTLDLKRRGHRFSREVLTPIYYDGVQIARYKMDFVVDDVVVLEVKSTERLNPNDERQLLNYLRATTYEVGLLLHFGPKPKFYRLVSTGDPRRP